MIVVRGTKRFLDRVRRLESIEVTSSGRLGDWYANVWFWRLQVALFVNATTLLPVLVPLAPTSSVIARFPAAFAEVATRVGVEPSAIDDEVAEMATWTLAKPRAVACLAS